LEEEDEEPGENQLIQENDSIVSSFMMRESEGCINY
jgi:hypothetical protein